MTNDSYNYALSQVSGVHITIFCVVCLPPEDIVAAVAVAEVAAQSVGTWHGNRRVVGSGPDWPICMEY